MTVLRKRKQKDGILPLHSAEPNGSPGTTSTKAPTRTLRKKQSNSHGTGRPVFGSKALYGFIVLFIGVLSLAIFLMTTTMNRKGPSDEIVHHNKHFHSHTANKMQHPNKLDRLSGNGMPGHVDQRASVSPQHASSIDDSDEEQQQHHRRIIPMTIQCSDGSDGVVNDDYCDCPDGSDEPETSACSHLTIQQATFSCADGSATLYTSRVLDGVKDCADGSDEIRLES